MLNLQWCDDVLGENIATTMGIEYAVDRVTFDAITLLDPNGNGARLSGPIAGLSDDYAQRMRLGARFPRTWVFQNGDAIYKPAAGSHRLGAVGILIRNGDVAVPYSHETYVLKTSDKMLIETFIRSHNITTNGAGVSKEDQIQQALYMISTYGMTMTDAEKNFGVSATTLSGRIKANEVRVVLNQNRIDCSGVPNSTLEHLSRLPDEGAVKKLGKLIAQHRPAGERVREIVNRVVSGPSESKRMATIKAFEKDLVVDRFKRSEAAVKKTTQPLRPSRIRRDKFISLLEKLADFLSADNGGEAFTSWGELQIASPADKKKVVDLWELCNFRLSVVVSSEKS